jgi:hypothetical protein
MNYSMLSRYEGLDFEEAEDWGNPFGDGGDDELEKGPSDSSQWMLSLSIGVATGCVGFLLSVFVAGLTSWKWATVFAQTEKVRKAPSWPRSWANFSPLQLYSHRNAWANLHILGQPYTFLAEGRADAGLPRAAVFHSAHVDHSSVLRLHWCAKSILSHARRLSTATN